jgi:site-specific recombinase XerD
MTAAAFTAEQWADRLARPTKDRAYQLTRTGAVVAFEYLPWKKLSAAATSLDQIERDLARGCMAFPDMEPGDWTAGDIITVLNLFPERSRHRAISHWRGFLGWYADWHDMPELHRQVRLLPRMPKKQIPVYDLFEPAEQEALLRGTARSRLPERDLLALLVVMLGPRKGELEKLRLEHFNHASRVVVFHGKGNKERIVPYDDELHVALLDFLATPIARQDRIPIESDHLFFPSGASETHLLWTDPTRPMSKTALHRWWGRQVENAGIRYRKLHMNRHTTATELVEADVNAFDVKEWLGHERTDTTEVYVHNARRRLRGASDKLAAFRSKRGDSAE